MNIKDQQKFITVAEIARILGISRIAAFKKVHSGIKAGTITAIQKGRGYIIDKETLPEEVKQEIDNSQQEAVDVVLRKGSKQSIGSNRKDLGFEKELWQAADRLRGNIDAAQYKYVVLGLLFLKYVSDAFYHRREELERWVADPKNKKYFVADPAQRKAIIDDKDQYRSVGVFYIPAKTRLERRDCAVYR